MSVTLSTVARTMEVLGLNDQLLQQVIDNPVHRAQVLAAFQGQYPAVQTVDKEQWVDRETSILRRLAELDLPVGEDIRQVESAWREDFTMHHRYVPVEMTQSSLLSAFQKLSVAVTKGTGNQGQQLLTEAGVFDCDLTTIGRPTDFLHHPFGLDNNEQETWCKKQGGDGLASTEEILYLLLRSRLELGYIPVVGVWVGSRNYTHGTYGRLGVEFDTCYSGLHIGGKDSGNGHNWSCVPRKFISAVS